MVAQLSGSRANSFLLLHPRTHQACLSFSHLVVAKVQCDDQLLVEPPSEFLCKGSKLAQVRVHAAVRRALHENNQPFRLGENLFYTSDGITSRPHAQDPLRLEPGCSFGSTSRIFSPRSWS